MGEGVHLLSNGNGLSGIGHPSRPRIWAVFGQGQLALIVSYSNLFLILVQRPKLKKGSI